MIITEVSRSMDATGVLSLCEDKSDFKAVVTMILSSLSDIFPLLMVGKSALLLYIWFRGHLYTTVAVYKHARQKCSLYSTNSTVADKQTQQNNLAIYDGYHTYVKLSKTPGIERK